MSPEKVLYRLSGGDKKIVVPSTLTQEVIRLHHDIPTAGHAAVAKTLERVKRKFWWKGMEKSVLDFVRTCKSCSRRTDYGKAKAPLGPLFNEPEQPFEVVAADVIGPLPVSESGNKYILSVMDHFTRYSEFIPLPDQTAEQVARALVQRVITKFGVMKSLVTDQGANFTSELLKNVCKFLHVRKIQTTGFHPQSNGRIERVHSTIARMLSHFVNKSQTNWDEYLPYVTMAYNSQVHETTGYSPYEMLFGRKMEAPLEADLTITDDTAIYDNHIETLRSKLREAYEAAGTRKALARGRNEEQYNKKTKTIEYKVGQSVWLHTPSIGRHRVKKLSQPWKGPYKIVGIPSPLNVVLRIRGREVVVHVNRIKPCLSRVENAGRQADCVRTENPDSGEASPRVQDVDLDRYERPESKGHPAYDLRRPAWSVDRESLGRVSQIGGPARCMVGTEPAAGTSRGVVTPVAREPEEPGFPGESLREEREFAEPMPPLSPVVDPPLVADPPAEEPEVRVDRSLDRVVEEDEETVDNVSQASVPSREEDRSLEHSRNGQDDVSLGETDMELSGCDETCGHSSPLETEAEKESPEGGPAKKTTPPTGARPRRERVLP